MKSRVVVKANGSPLSDGGELWSAAFFDYTDYGLKKAEYRLLDLAKFTTDGVEVNAEYEGPKPNPEEMKTHTAARRLRRSLSKPVSDEGNELPHSVPQFVATVFALAAMNGVNPVKVELEVNGFKGSAAELLVKIIRAAKEFAIDSTLGYIERALSVGISKDLVKALEDAASKGSQNLTELEKYIVKFLTSPIVSAKFSQVWLYLDAVFNMNLKRHGNLDVLELLREAANHPRNLQVARLADALTVAIENLKNMLDELAWHAGELELAQDPATIAKTLSKLVDVEEKYSQAINKALEDAEEYIEALKDETILFSQLKDDSLALNLDTR